MDVLLILLGISFIIFFGYLAESLFKRLGIPDVLFLIGLGFLLARPEMFGAANPAFIDPARLSLLAPLFTTFALFFIVYNGAFSVDLSAFARGLKKSLGLTFYNFVLSVTVIFAIMFLFTGDSALSLLAGFVLGGISSAFVIPVISNLKVKDETFSALALESTLTDVLVIVFSLAMLQILVMGTFDAKKTVTDLLGLFSIAILVGVVAAFAWMVAIRRIFGGHGAYMLTIAYLIAVYAFTELVGGSGVVAALFFGITLRNSNKLKVLAAYIHSEDADHDKVLSPLERRWGGVIPPAEIFFYSQISFFLKTFFFVYIGMLFDISEPMPIFIGFIIALCLMAARWSSSLVLRGMDAFDRSIVSSVFAMGLAAAAIAQQLLITNQALVAAGGVPIVGAQLLVNVTYAVIVFSIILSSINVFFSKRTCALEAGQPCELPLVR